MREVYRDEAGNKRVETWSLEGFAHAVPIEADGDTGVCEQATEYIMDTDLCAIRHVADFWQLR